MLIVLIAYKLSIPFVEYFSKRAESKYRKRKNWRFAMFVILMINVLFIF